ncbi:hypothetical protein RFI_31337 [Reticulomyxa filosa]|uniref:SH3 domain-containing protein n=1 Tax=Reticulomyxa filosa TaxID=46433 RepID=X6LXG4_RETFI|nr:hypothetical protein RFI_31337 [Reticulomyxa filosa]|eukprot:ETO06056.1 hypothetical protein RFI_31337 [Reticulomyxa filosa]
MQHKNEVEKSAAKSMSSTNEMQTTENVPIKAKVICTYVPKSPVYELTVIAGEVVDIIDNMTFSTYQLKSVLDDSIQGVIAGSKKKIYMYMYIIENESELIEHALYENEQVMIDDSHPRFHWTLIQSRNGKVGLIPSFVLSYTQNPIHDVWNQIYVNFTYSAKTEQEIDVAAGEKISICGIANMQGLIQAKNRYQELGNVPLSFLEIPVVKPLQFERVQSYIVAFGGVQQQDLALGDLLGIQGASDSTKRLSNPFAKRLSAKGIGIASAAVFIPPMQQRSDDSMLFATRLNEEEKERKKDKALEDGTTIDPMQNMIVIWRKVRVIADFYANEYVTSKDDPQHSVKTFRCYIHSYQPLFPKQSILYICMSEKIIGNDSTMTVLKGQDIEVTGVPTKEGWILARFVYVQFIFFF